MEPCMGAYASQSLRILYIFILRTEKVTTFEAKLERKW